MPDFEARHFVTYSDGRLATDVLASHYHTRLSRLPDFTALHIFVVTLRCDHTCQYCQVSRVSENRSAFDMSVEDANAALEHVFRSPSRALKIEFQGGEPLLNFELIRHIIERVERRNDERDIQFVITSNLAFLTDEILEFCRNRPVYFSTSLDGPSDLHNANRPRPGRNSYEKAIEGIRRIRAELGPDRVSALMTSTLESLSQPERIVDEYIRQDFRSIFLRHISPYGFAVKSAPRIGYETDAFLNFFKRALGYIIAKNLAGIPLVESYSALLLTRILTSQATGYVDLQSPSGIGIAAIIYNYNGKVYCADEGRMLAEMGDETFCLGHVRDSYRSLFLNNQLLPMLSQSMVEAVPMCTDCAFQLYCGTDPVYHHRTQGDFVGHRPTSGFCRRNMEVIRHLITILESRSEAARVFRSWVS
jgi:His-Xaa-Ser system radical SAM maturase HxsB